MNLFQFEFIQNAFISGTVIAVIAPLIGNFLLVRRYALLADTLAHISLIGVAISLIVGFSPIVFALIVAVVAALAMDELRERQKLTGDTVLSLFLTGGVALSVMLLSLTDNFNANFLGFLFGSITTLGRVDTYIITSFGILVVGVIVLLYRALFYLSFDEEVAKVSGLPIRLVNSILVASAAVMVVLSMRIVGILLIGALSVIPPITTMRFSCSFKQTILSSILLSVLSVWSGLLLSYYAGTSSGATIVSIALFFFIISLFFPKARCE